MRAILFLLLLCAGMAQAQVETKGKAVYLEGSVSALHPVVISSDIARCDTVPVWVIYMDSVRLYAADPEFDMRIEIAPGWRINHGWGTQEWVDQDGRKFNPDNVILDKPRKPRRNPFKE